MQEVNNVAVPGVNTLATSSPLHGPLPMTAQLEILRNQTRRACEAWCSSAHSRGRANPKVQLAACDRAASVWDLLVLVGQNTAADRAAQEDLGRLAPAADAARLRMLVLHRDLLQAEAVGALPPAPKQGGDAPGHR